MDKGTLSKTTNSPTLTYFTVNLCILPNFPSVSLTCSVSSEQCFLGISQSSVARGGLLICIQSENTSTGKPWLFLLFPRLALWSVQLEWNIFFLCVTLFSLTWWSLKLNKKWNFVASVNILHIFKEFDPMRIQLIVQKLNFMNKCINKHHINVYYWLICNANRITTSVV